MVFGFFLSKDTKNTSHPYQRPANTRYFAAITKDMLIFD